MSAQKIYSDFEAHFINLCAEVGEENPDPSHDIFHVLRVVESARVIATAENADLNIVIPAAYLHDIVFVGKKDPRRSIASQLSAKKAISILEELGYPSSCLNEISHAIEAHSFSSGIAARTLEAKVVQDADRLDGLGAIGVARCFGLSGLIRRPFYNFEDPFCDSRSPNDQTNSLDHFFIKLLKTAGALHTPTARAEGLKRLQFMKVFLAQLKKEIC
jgi:uncharacterized protein